MKDEEKTREQLVNELALRQGVAELQGAETERERMEAALRESEQRYRQLFEDIGDAVMVYGLQGRFLDCNKAALQRLGYSRKEFSRLVAADIVHPDFHLVMKDNQKRIWAGESTAVESAHRCKDGKVIPVEVNARRIEYQGEPAILAIVRDITERKWAEETLARERYLMGTLMDNIPDHIYFKDAESRFIRINKAQADWLGLGGPAQAVGKTDFDVFADEHARQAYADEQAVMETGRPLVGVEEKETWPDGRETWVSTTKVPLRDEDGKIVGTFGISRDITERKQAEEQRDGLLAELDAKNRELESFAYTVSHDLKAPLVSLDGFSFVLRKEFRDQLGEEGKHYLERIRANVAHMDVLITHLLELSRIGRVVGSMEEIDVAALLRDIREELAIKLEEGGAEFVVQEPLPAVRADRSRIRQVFANLIDNAIKFRSEGKPLRIEVGCQEERGFYRFHVADSGIGIAPQYHERIFEPFRQLDPKTEGVGMGLALVKKIVEHHGGRLWVESEAGKGSTFYLTIPAITQKERDNREQANDR